MTIHGAGAIVRARSDDVALLVPHGPSEVPLPLPLPSLDRPMPVIGRAAVKQHVPYRADGAETVRCSRLDDDQDSAWGQLLPGDGRQGQDRGEMRQFCHGVAAEGEIKRASGFLPAAPPPRGASPGIPEGS